jgi:uncharacterized phage protein (TIGR01671 family)
MREIKFRAWNGKAMEHGGFSISPSNGRIIDSCIISKVKDDSPLMQYTGLKDKNGVEIYEGDILRGEYVVPEEHLILFMSVEFITGCFCIRDKFGSTNPLHEDNETTEVIGNIYENPELLEK